MTKILHAKNSSSNRILTTTNSRRSRPIEDALDPIMKNIFKKYRNVPFGMFSKLYVMTERDIIKFFQRYPEYLEIKQFELIYNELLAHREEIRHSTYEPFVRKRYPLTQRLYCPSVPITGFQGTTTDI